ncbi:hypothetical protein HanOQP8_Chr17g0673511 [Helianthus annuus]|nr:hypothetical protein HanHA89_Chr17g0720121 [Helianthus annuus]KAJ0637407.1 hypothetical protein HanOQP8_Chr17g0673511 [Helianthus annuus]
MFYIFEFKISGCQKKTNSKPAYTIPTTSSFRKQQILQVRMMKYNQPEPTRTRFNPTKLPLDVQSRSFLKKRHFFNKTDPTRPETRSDPDPFQPEPVPTRTKTTLFLIDPF